MFFFSLFFLVCFGGPSSALNFPSNNYQERSKGSIIPPKASACFRLETRCLKVSLCYSPFPFRFLVSFSLNNPAFFSLAIFCLMIVHLLLFRKSISVIDVRWNFSTLAPFAGSKSYFSFAERHHIKPNSTDKTEYMLTDCLGPIATD